MKTTIFSFAFFWGGAVFALTPYCSPPLALAAGICFALIVPAHPYARFNSRAVKLLLQISVVGLGFGVDFGAALATTRDGFALTVATIAGTLSLGLALGKVVGAPRTLSELISVGTAICGGSAIAAVAPALEAKDEEVSVALGTVFVLNALALFLFPPLGNALHLTQQQFGVWAAVAIHDTSSVVGAAAKYGSEALQTATTIKLARALWIVPLALGAAFIARTRSRKNGQSNAAGGKLRASSFPMFILFFVCASLLSTFVPIVSGFSGNVVALAKKGLTLTLFLLGTGLSLASLRRVGVRPFALGVVLWLIVSFATLWYVVAFFGTP